MGVKASAIAQSLGASLIGDDLSLHHAKPLTDLQDGAVGFINTYAEKWITVANEANNVLLLVTSDYAGKLTVSHIVVDNPRLAFARVLAEFFDRERPVGIAETAIIAESATIGDNVYIGHYSVIGEQVYIGDNTEIRNHVVIQDKCVIGQGCTIKSNVVIGEEGFGFEFADDGTPIRIPHLGAVTIGDDVEIGAQSSIARGTLANTIISNHVKIDDHVFIAHNVFIDENSMIIAGAEVSGSVRIGKNVWVGPQVCILNQVKIGDDAFFGLGAVVVKDVEPNMVMAGNPAKALRKRFQEH